MPVSTQQGNGDLSTAALTVTLDASRDVDLHWIGATVTDNSGAVQACSTTETVTMYLLDKGDSDHNYELARYDLDGERGLFWQPDKGPFTVPNGWQVKVNCTQVTDAEYLYVTITYAKK